VIGQRGGCGGSWPRPQVAKAEGAVQLRPDVHLLGVAERADSMAPDACRLDVADVLVVILSAGFAKVTQEVQDGVLGHGDDPWNCSCGSSLTTS